jgi:LuxR family transcriptional regulator, maltose regulon positive regulatory protein
MGATETSTKADRSGSGTRSVTNVTPASGPTADPVSVTVPVRYRPPVASPADLRRERLLSSLTDDPASVTLICGPAGAGKTSLLAGWVPDAVSAGAIVAWLSLDRRDDDPSSLWAGILGSLRSTGRFPPDARLHALAAPPQHADPGFIDAFVDELSDAGAPVWLVLDDLQRLRSDASPRSLDELVQRLPSGVHVVLTSRSDPPIALARLRVQGRLRELRAADLAFTRGETSAFLRRRAVELPQEAISVIHERTEGWPAGVAIAAIALLGTDDPAGLVARFSGDDHAVADYLVSEVLATMPSELHTFLMRTSVCSRLSVGLAQQLSGRDDAAKVLDTLVRDNALTERLGRGRDFYRYHELLRTFLQGELRRSQPGLEPALHTVAAQWWEDHREPLHAMEHLIRAGDTEQLADLIDTEATGVLLDGGAQALAETLSGVDDGARTVPRLALAGAAAALEMGDLDGADRWLAGIDVPAIIDGRETSEAAFAASVALARARYGGRLDLALDALETTSAGDTGHRDRDLYALYHRGVARAYGGRYAEAAEDLDRAVSIAQASRREGLLVDCLSFLGGAHATLGHLPLMRQHAQRALEVAERHGWSRSGAIAHAHMLVGWSDFLRADEAAAFAHTTLALAALDGHVEPDVEFASHGVHLFVTVNRGGGYRALRDYRATLLRLLDAPMPPALLAFVAPLLVRISLDLGERSMAQEIAEAVRTRSPDPGEPALLRAMLLHDAGRHDAARRELAAIIEGGGRCHVVTSEVRVHLLLAELEADREVPTRAHDHLCEALRIAEPVEVVEPFLESERIERLLNAARGRFGRSEDFAQRVLQAAAARSVPLTVEMRLTPGELAVLRELPSLLSLREIAESRSLSLNTVKSHLRSVYRKLGVTGRREAVEAARSRELL